MQLQSKIKSFFSEETIDTLAKLCDTMRIPSVIRKMELVQQIIKRNEPQLQFSILGGATNRICLFINGLPVKFALDSQGYKDNLQEYALSPELQPYVPKAFETNGYILICEPWRALTMEEFQLRKMEILKVLDMMAQDYLLGDVGYLKKNYTNWGVNDQGNVGILDYAYIHRATENLFTCEVCGQGILRYDSSYSVLKCSNATVCHAKYTYLDRKIIQGDKVDLDMIEEMKKESIVLRGSKKSIEVTNDDGILVKGNKRIIKTRNEYLEYLKEEQNMGNFDGMSALDLLIKKVDAKNNNTDTSEIDSQLDELLRESEVNDMDDDDDVEVIIDYNPEEDDDDYDYDEDGEVYEDDTSDIDYVVPLSELVNKVNGPLTTQIGELVPECTVGGKNNGLSLATNENIGVSLEEPEYHEGVTLNPKKSSDNKAMIKEEDVDKLVEDMADALHESLDGIITSKEVLQKAEENLEKSMVTFNKKTYDEPVTLPEGKLVEEKDIDSKEEVEDKKSTEEESSYDLEDYRGIIINGKPVKELD